MKEYLVFIGDCYYPGPGVEDFKKDFDDLDSAKKYAIKNTTKSKWYQIVKYSTFEIVDEYLNS